MNHQVIIVENVRPFSRLLSFLLQKLGYSKFNVHCVESNPEALLLYETLIQHNPNVIVFVDIFLDHDSGLNVIRNLKVVPNKGLLIIAMSAYKDAEMIEQCMAAGADHFFFKMLSKNLLHDALLRLEDKSQIPLGIPKHLHD